MLADDPLITIVDDDAAICDAVSDLLASVGIEAVSFGSPREVMAAPLPDRPGCLIVDVRMPGGSGLDLQRQINGGRNRRKPIIFLTAHGDIPMSVQAMKEGAVDFLTKPFRDQTLLDAVAAGIEQDRDQRRAAEICDLYLERYATLTPREREVLQCAASGKLNKQIAYALGISEVTVKLHRGNAMNKMKLSSVGELVRCWEVLAPHLDADRGQTPPPGAAVH
jgi:FixJ family two-component response regulator